MSNTTKRSKDKQGSSPTKPSKRGEADAAFRPFGALQTMRDELKAREDRGDKPAPARPSQKPSTARAAAAAKAAPEDEALALYRMMNGVTPLADKGAKRLTKSTAQVAPADLAARRAEVEAPVRAEDEAVHAHLRALVEGGRFEVLDDGRRVEGRRHGVTPDVARKLRRGMFPIDARLDLHGESAASAPKVLERFLRDQRTRGERCVLVIHGKGGHSPGQVGILRGEMSAWLSQGGASAHVAAFATAGEGDGGEGAVYVLLTR
jgi:DNA-nicking Smr family endonuclease